MIKIFLKRFLREPIANAPQIGGVAILSGIYANAMNSTLAISTTDLFRHNVAAL